MRNWPLSILSAAELWANSRRFWIGRQASNCRRAELCCGSAAVISKRPGNHRIGLGRMQFPSPSPCAAFFWLGPGRKRDRRRSRENRLKIASGACIQGRFTWNLCRAPDERCFAKQCSTWNSPVERRIHQTVFLAEQIAGSLSLQPCTQVVSAERARMRCSTWNRADSTENPQPIHSFT